MIDKEKIANCVSEYIEDCLTDWGNAVVIDIETDGVDPYSPDTDIIYIGLYNGNQYRILEGDDLHFDILTEMIEELAGGASYQQVKLVGHNLPFDLQFLVTKNPRWDGYSHCRLWDTAVAEYMLSGQHYKFPSLDDTSKRYGGSGKLDQVGELLKQGVKISEMDRDMVIDYLRQDLKITWDVYQAQLASLKTDTMLLRNILTQMEAQRAYVWLMTNGMCFDRTKLVTAHFTCEQQIAINTQKMETYIKQWDMPEDTNPTSNVTLSTLIWGSPGIKFRKKEVVGTYKNGKPKEKFVDYVWSPEWALDVAEHQVDKKAHGCYDVSEHRLNYVCEVLRNCPEKAYAEKDLLSYIELVMDTRKISKVDGTYFVPLINQIDGAYDGKVHPSINQTATHTGRTSANNPNSQNLPPLARSYCTPSTWTLAGGTQCLLESDFAQLEVSALALLTEDPQLVHDINAGIDIHFKTGKQVMGWKKESDMTKAQRRIVKGVNFGIIYGGGAKAIAHQTGADENMVRELIKAFYRTYPQVKVWQRENIEQADKIGAVTDMSPIVGKQYARVAMMPSISGRRYCFIESEIPREYRRPHGPEVNFKPTEIKNYFVQGFATGDMVPITVGLLARIVAGNYGGKALLINVVHDSLLWDCMQKHVAQDVGNLSSWVVSNHLPTVLNTLFGIPPAVTFKMDHEIKTNW